jgi:uncharacterized protein YecE (DUF72 family)
MAADTLAELLEFGGRIGMNPNWIQLPPKTRYPHFDLNYSKRVKAVKLGAVEIRAQVLVGYSKQLRVEFYAMKAGKTDSALDRALRRRNPELITR